MEKDIKLSLKEKRKVVNRNNYVKNRDRILAQALAYQKQRRKMLKVRVIDHYSNGTMKCACCGEKHLEFLTIDHIAGGGNKHRKSIKQTNFYAWLVRNEYPEGYRVLCMNCNWSRKYGACPHEEEQKEMIKIE